MNLRQLRYFDRIAETGNMTHAAQQLNVAQTALGLQLKNLEAELGVNLVRRHSRGVSITPAGQLLHKRIQEVLRSLDEAVLEVRRFEGLPHDPAYVGLTPSVMALLGTEIFTAAERIADQMPLRFVEVMTSGQVAALQRGELQFGFAYNVPRIGRIERVALLEEPLFFVSAPGTGEGATPVALREALGSDLALLSQHDIVWNLLKHAAARQGLDVSVSFEVQSTSAIKKLISRGAATGILPYGVVSAEVRDGTLSARIIDDPNMSRTLFFMHATDTDAAKRALLLERFLPWLVSTYGELLRPHAEGRLKIHDSNLEATG